LCDEDDGEKELDFNASNTSQVINHLFFVLNSSMNFILYCAVRKSFRHTILRILRCGYVKGVAVV
jgi:hypothetical protein